MGEFKFRPPEAAWSRDLAALRASFDGEANPVRQKRASLALWAEFPAAAIGVVGTCPLDLRAWVGALRPPERALRRPLRTESAIFAAWVDDMR